MAKQGGKNRGKPKPKRKAKTAPEGDLETIETHVKAYLDGKSEAASVLTDMGRDASFTVLKLAQEQDNAELEQFARRLAAIPPQVTTNLHELRRKSVRRRIEMERRDATAAVDVADLAVAGGTLGLFDPQRVIEDLATGGRPRRRAERLEAGDVACIGLPKVEPVAVKIHHQPPPEGQDTARLRLKVESGLLFVGPPEASDGPRMGTVRLDPFSTLLDEHAASGRFVRFPNGVFAVMAYLKEGEVQLHVVDDADPSASLDLSPMAPVTLPRGDA